MQYAISLFMDLLLMEAQVKTFTWKVRGPLYLAQQEREKVSVTCISVLSNAIKSNFQRKTGFSGRSSSLRLRTSWALHWSQWMNAFLKGLQLQTFFSIAYALMPLALCLSPAYCGCSIQFVMSVLCHQSLNSSWVSLCYLLQFFKFLYFQVMLLLQWRLGGT